MQVQDPTRHFTRMVQFVMLSYLLLLPTGLFSQEGFSVKGKTLDAKTRAPLPTATIQLYTLPDSQFVQGTSTDTSGYFQLTALPEGRYQIQLHYLGYQEHLAEFGLQEDLNLGSLLLEENPTELTTVVVQGKTYAVQHLPGKTVLNVGQNALADGGTALDALKIIPSVVVTPEGGVSIRGNSAIQILVDGQPSAQAAIQGSRFLEQLDAANIEKIEVITNPSARYAASGSGGIINIIRKKRKGEGWKGQIKATVDQKLAAALNLQSRYTSGKWSGFLNYQARRRVRESWSREERTQYPLDTTRFLSAQSRSAFADFRQTLEAGADYFFDKKTYLTLAGQYYSREKENEQQKLARLWQSPGTFVENQYSTVSEPERNEGGGVEIRFQKEEGKHRNWTAVLSYGHSLEAEIIERMTEVEIMEPDYLEAVRTDYQDLNDRLVVTTELLRPVGAQGKLEAGVRYVLRSINQTFSASSFDYGQMSWKPLPEGTDHFRYQDHVFSSFAVLHNKSKRWEYELGLRLEQAFNHYESFSLTQSFEQNYLKLFPSLQVQYHVGEQSTIYFSYGKRIDRPSPNRLNPFPDYGDPNAVKRGNPALLPSIVHNAELGYGWQLSSVSLTGSLFYQYFRDAIQRVRTVREDGKVLVRPVNLASLVNFGLESSLKATVSSWWETQLACMVYQQAYTSNVLGQQAAVTLRLSSHSDFQISKKIVGQLLVRYQAPQATVQGNSAGQFVADLALQYRFIKPNVRITLSCNDLFYTQREREWLDTNELEEERWSRWDSRRIQLTFGIKL